MAKEKEFEGDEPVPEKSLRSYRAATDTPWTRFRLLKGGVVAPIPREISE